jgi:Protein of unknown function (DUF4065)
MQFDRAKLKAVILYTCRKCPPSRLGAVKLHKVLYFFDMLHFAQAGLPAVGATYRKRPHGPTCDQLLPSLAELSKSGMLQIDDVDYHGFRKTEYRATVEPEIARFNADELSLLDDVIEFVCVQNSARTISDYSHQRPWESVGFGDVIPYESSYLLFPMQVTPEAFAKVEQGAAEIEEARSGKGSVDVGTYGDFRGRVLRSIGGH